MRNIHMKITDLQLMVEHMNSIEDFSPGWQTGDPKFKISLNLKGTWEENKLSVQSSIKSLEEEISQLKSILN